MEEPPKPEQRRNEIVHALKTLGFENPEAKKLFTEWVIEQEEKADSLGTPDARFDFEMERTHVYFEAGLQAEALVALNDVRDRAIEERRQDHLDRISDAYQEFFEHLNAALAIELITCDEVSEKKLTREQKEVLMEQIEKDEGAVYLAHLNFTESGVRPNASEKWWLMEFEKILLKTENPEIAEYIRAKKFY